MYKSLFNGYKAIIFDLDGTIIDDQEVWDNAVKKVLKKYITSETPYWGVRGFPLLNLIQDIKNGNDLAINFSNEEAYSAINREFFENFYDVEVKLGFREFADELMARDFRLVLCTNTDRPIAEEIVSRLNLGKYFEFMLTRSEVKDGKPDPDIYLLAMKKLGLKREEILIFEDSVAGFIAAEKAKINSIIVMPEDGYAGDYGSNAKVFIRDFTEIVPFLDTEIEDYFLEGA